MDTNKNISCLSLFSGGLDSILAVKILMEQGIEVVGVSFRSDFYDTLKASLAAEELGIDLIEIDISSDMLGLVENPVCGYGKNMNPCIDCHALMIRRAARYMGEQATAEGGKKFSFIATGEVLGQRPFSQNKEALQRVQKIAGVEVLRPLSALLLPETSMEKGGLVDRTRLLSISGRSREAQFDLAKKYGINSFPTPAGGCLLTDPCFSSRLAEMIRYWGIVESADIELLKNGRIFWITLVAAKIRQDTPIYSHTDRLGLDKALIVVGRNEQENNNLEGLLQKGDFMLKLKEITGPSTLVRIRGEILKKEQDIGKKILEMPIPEKLQDIEASISRLSGLDKLIANAALLTGFYSTKARGKTVKIEIKFLN